MTGSPRTLTLWVAGSPLIPANTAEPAARAIPHPVGVGSGRPTQAHGQAPTKQRGSVPRLGLAQLKGIFVIFDQLTS